MAHHPIYLDFEKHIAEFEGKIEELKVLQADNGQTINLSDEIIKLEQKSQNALQTLYSKLSPWQKTQVARHPGRPHFCDYVGSLITDFIPLAGDRKFAEDHAIIAGFGRFDGLPIAVIGQEKGHDTLSRLKHNFGMAGPEGYRKAVRIMSLAEKFKLPILTLIDTAGAYPGIGAEERGQAEAIAQSIARCLSLEVPLISIIIGEGGSGGAIAIASANRIYMLEHAIYSVASPEASASILWRETTKAADAAQAMKITAQDLLAFGIIDGVIPEPLGGGHRDPDKVIANVKGVIASCLEELSLISAEQLKQQRKEKFLDIHLQAIA